jgi:mono/diheme cytochrome c family protein
VKGLRAILGLVAGLVLAGDLSPAPRPAMPARVGPDDALVPEGRFVFERNCLVCHGKWGDGRGEMATGMVPRPRKFTAGTFKFRSTPSGSLPTDTDLARTIRGGLFGTSMPTFQHLSDREVKAVIEYVKTFSRKWTAPENYAAPLSLPQPPAWLSDAAARPQHARAGRLVFLANCAPCHGSEGRGHGPAAENLEDDWGQPALPADLSRPSTKSGPEPRDLYRVLVTGLNGTPMPSFLESTTEAQRWELVAYLLSLRAGEGGL